MFKKIEKCFRAAVYSRCDDRGFEKYFTKDDFPGLNKKDYVFTSSGGNKLVGSFYSYDCVKPGRIVVFDHGMGGGHLSYMKEIEMLARHGYLVFAYDHTGCMASEGEGTGGFLQSLIDLNDAISTLKNDDEYGKYELSVIGHSWGAFSTLNISAFHSDIKHLVAISGFISLSSILKQFFWGVLTPVRKRVYQSELSKNPGFVNCNALDSLKNTDAEVLVIHSTDDKTVSYKKNFCILKDALQNKPNIEFLSVSGKNHNPNYTETAVIELSKAQKALKKALRKKLLTTNEQKAAFKASFDWDKMTEQDGKIWDSIFKTLEK